MKKPLNTLSSEYFTFIITIKVNCRFLLKWLSYYCQIKNYLKLRAVEWCSDDKNAFYCLKIRLQKKKLDSFDGMSVGSSVGYKSNLFAAVKSLIV